MDPALWAALGGGAALLLLLAGVALAAGVIGRRAHRREQALLATAHADVAALRERVEELSSELAATRAGAAALEPRTTEYLITTAGLPAGTDLPVVPQRAVLSVTLGEPLVKLTAFGYGLRRALSPRTRNRIAFEMRREVKRARKARRRAARRTRVHRVTEETAA